ncbi:hypothetical protein DPMN_113495 [Dreissena polymorpha]|uniref:Uncharacterized protein n=1 Tax=Dreissena polymorpha TaxID=45954 RepID=A0A9D4KHL9_DREPO|nr:hypothetical protein DPMN_113495 [Dreissena polymorpha]
MQQIPEDIQENVRAVLLSKTDGSGILVSTLLRDYKNIVGRPLMYKNLGYQTLEAFIKDLPNVCRLEYSERDMAYKLFGIAKPSTFVSSFVKKAEGGSPSISEREGERSKPRNRRGPRVQHTTDLNDKWEPNPRGLYSICFDNKSTGLNKADIALKFAEAGHVEDIHLISSGMAFIRYSDEDAAKKAVQMYGESLKVHKADERRGSKRDQNQARDGRRRNNDSGTGDIENYSDLQRKNEYYQRNRNENNNNQQKVNGHRFSDAKDNKHGSDSDWEDEFSDKPRVKKTENSCMEETENSLSAISSPTEDSKTNLNGNSPRMDDTMFSHSGNRTVPAFDAVRGRRGRGGHNTGGPRRGLHEDPLSPKQTASSQITQVYIGNWPNEGTENELKALVAKYQTERVRMYLDKRDSNKRFAFVDCLSLEDAEQMVREMHNQIHRNRNLLVRLGNKNSVDHHSDAGTGSVHSEMGRLSLNTGPHQAGLKSPNSSSSHHSDAGSVHIEMGRLTVNSGPHQAGLKSPNVISSHHSPASSVGKGDKPGMSRQLESADDELPPLEELVSPRMPALEGRMPALEGRMPALEGRMLALEGRMPALEGRMPALEGMHGYHGYGCLDDMPPIEENLPQNLPQKGAMGRQEIQGHVKVLVTNFPYGTSKDALFYLFERFGVLDIGMINQAEMGRSTLAYITLANMELAQQAVMSLDQTMFCNRKLTVAFTPDVAMQLDSTAHASQDMMQRYAGNSFQESPMGGSRSRQNYNNNRAELQQLDFAARATPSKPIVTSNDYTFALLTSKLKDYSKIMSKLLGESDLLVGMVTKLMITHVENEKFFWAQRLEDNVNGANGNLPKLQELSLRLQKPDQKQGPIRSLGRCTAQFEGDWYSSPDCSVVPVR